MLIPVHVPLDLTTVHVERRCRPVGGAFTSCCALSHRCSSDSSFVPTRSEILAGLQRGASLEVRVLSGLVSEYNTSSLNNVAGS